MSLEEARAFVEDARLDRALFVALRNYDLSRDPAKIMPLAIDRGYHFTPAELDEVLPKWDHTPPPKVPDAVAEVTKQQSSGRSVRFLVISVVLTAVFAYLFFDSYQDYARLRDHGVTTVGIVEGRGVKERSGRYGWGKDYYVDVVFEVYGTNRAITLRQEVSEDMYDVYGFVDTATVIYDPDDPKTARLESQNSPSYFSLLSAIIFGVLSVLAIGWVMAQNNKRLPIIGGWIKRFNDARRGIRILG